MWIEIFQSGMQTDSSGRSSYFSEEMLDRIAGAYNEKVFENSSFSAPIVKGHPKSEDPAYGWVERLARRGRSLYAKIKELTPGIVREVREGLYRKVSVALKPENFMLRHVGLLGAAAPAVEGMALLDFSGTEADMLYCIDMESHFEELEEENESPKAGEPTYKEMSERLKELEKINKELEELNSRYHSQLGIMEKEQRLKEFREFANALVEYPAGSIITPASAGQLVDILEMAYEIDSGINEIREFSEGESCVEKVKCFISNLKPAFSTREFALKSPAFAIGDGKLAFSGRNVLPERMMLHEKAKELQEETPGLSYEEAVCAAQRIFTV